MVEEITRLTRPDQLFIEPASIGTVQVGGDRDSPEIFTLSSNLALMYEGHIGLSPLLGIYALLVDLLQYMC